MKKPLIGVLILSGITMSGLYGCATRGYVDEQIDTVMSAEVNNVRGDLRTELDSIRESIRTNEEDIQEVKDTVKKNQERIQYEMGLIEEALERARAGNKVSEGKLIYEMTMSDESVRFALDKSELSTDAMAALDVFASELIQENGNVYIEIQGHTDDIGPEKYNLELGQARADAVKRYLHTQHRIALNRINTISYGESKPLVGNDTPENRARNRRVMLLVME